jgi:hypothetical protein
MSITIKHLDGPLKGQPDQTFDDKYPNVVFGRDPEKCQVVYPPNYNVVGKEHFELRRGKAGDYTVGLFGPRYVGIDGRQADDGDPVVSGNVFRLGRKEDGPSFGVEIAKPVSDVLVQTGEQDVVIDPGVRERKLRRNLVYAGGAIAAALLVVSGVLVDQHYSALRIDAQIDSMRDAAADDAKKQFSEAELDRLKNAVYVVAQQEDKGYKPVATAWAFAPDKLATNAHVAKAVAAGAPGEFVLFGPNGGDPIQIDKNVVWHSGYETFKDYKPTIGKSLWGNFKPLDLISQYDVGILTVDPSTPLPKANGSDEPVVLELASESVLENLKPGDPVASVGFPTEGISGADVASQAPSEMHFGNISALTDVFMCRATPDHQLLIQHSVPVAGGVSGSPLIDGSGKVIGLVTGGNTTGVTDAASGDAARISNAALINFAARADLLDALRAGKDKDQLASEQSYWQEASTNFASYFDNAAAAFVALAGDRYKVTGAETFELTQGKLGDDAKKPTFVKVPYVLDGTTQPGWKAEPGYLYGFIAYSESGVPIGINVTAKGTTEFLRDAKDPRKTSERELAPTAWVTVSKPTDLEVSLWSFTERPAEYVLYAYRWKLPDATGAADAATSQSP